MNNNNSRFLSGFLFWIIFIIVFWRFFLGKKIVWDIVNVSKNLSSSGVALSGVSIKKYTTIDKILKKEYFDKDVLDIEKMHENAVKGYVDAIGDPYTVYLTAEENEMFEEEMEWWLHFAGMWAVVTKKDDGVMIEEVLKGMAAYKAGIKPLDIIISIDGEETKNLWLNEAVKKIRGEKWTDVVLVIYRESEEKVLEITVTRDIVDVPSVKWELLDVEWKKILYVEISIIGEDTKRVFEKIIDDYKGKFDRIIIDLRGNGWGYLPTAVNLVSFFLPKNELITTARYSTRDDEVYRSKGYGDLEKMPVVVLIDGMSASASEIIASALDEKSNALLIGTKTFGKGSIQTLAEIEDGSSLKYTIGKRYTPSNKNIDKEGIVPDIEVAFNLTGYVEDERDNQLERAKEEVVKM